MKENKNIKDNISFLNIIKWYNIDAGGYIKGYLKNQPAVYIYKINYNNSTRFYVGSSILLKKRLTSHRCFVTNWNKDKYKNNCSGSPIFYNIILEFGWNNFEFGVLEYIDLSKIIDNKQKKYVLLEKEQYYLDNINPSLNVYKIASSPLGTKHGILFSINVSKAKRGKKIKSSKKQYTTPRIVTSETRLKLSSRVGGVSVKVFDKSNNLINHFHSISSAAKHFNVDKKTISRIFKTGISYDDYIYKFEVKDLRVWVYDSDFKLVNILDNILKTSIFYNIPYSTVYRYIKSGKLYKKNFYFYNINSKFNPHFDDIV